MMQSLAKIAVSLNVDGMGNKVMERLYRTGARNSRLSRRFQVLAFHKVSPEEHPYFAPVPPAVFEQYVSFLKQCYNVMDLGELVERNERGDVPERAVAITFDDGYADNYAYAFPILRKYGLTATIFVATGVIETGETLWHDRVFDAFRYTTKSEARIPWSDFPELNLGTAASRSSSLKIALNKSRELYGSKRLEFLQAVEETLTPGKTHEPETRMLTWRQIREMHTAGIRFGSHTVTHPVLSRLPQDELLRELIDSRQMLSEQLRAPVTGFAYPNGQQADYNEAVKLSLRNCGYAYAVSSRYGPNRAYADPFDLRRGQPWQTELELFRLNFFLQRHELTNVRN